MEIRFKHGKYFVIQKTIRFNEVDSSLLNRNQKH